LRKLLPKVWWLPFLEHGVENLSRRSYPVAWIIATHCSNVCPTILSEEFSLSRTPLLGFSLEPDDEIVSRRFCGSCTGFLSRDVL